MFKRLLPILVVVSIAGCSNESPSAADMGALPDWGVGDLGADQGNADASTVDLGTDAGAADSGALDAGSQDAAPADGGTALDAGPSPAAELCTSTGGVVASHLCCGATSDFPDSCGIGACGCAPSSSHNVAFCECGDGCFTPGVGCAARSDSP
ncbi:MAG: hypothetical protein IPK60_03465 [Sandaracinaceae bacterium]|nr:hypothetical protein [Sandaracinaceae bacterium]